MHTNDPDRSAIKASLAIVVHAMVGAVLAEPEARARHEAEFIEHLAHTWCDALLELRDAIVTAASDQPEGQARH